MQLGQHDASGANHLHEIHNKTMRHCTPEPLRLTALKAELNLQSQHEIQHSAHMLPAVSIASNVSESWRRCTSNMHSLAHLVCEAHMHTEKVRATPPWSVHARHCSFKVPNSRLESFMPAMHQHLCNCLHICGIDSLSLGGPFVSNKPISQHATVLCCWNA